jgi:hypothetical protein
MKIAFYSNTLCLRGTEINLYNLANYNETLLNNQSIIISQLNTNLDALEKFKNRFKVILSDFEEIDSIITKEKIDWIYITKAGKIDKYVTNIVPSFIHVVFRNNQPHGSKYIYISDWLAKNQGYDPESYSLPYIVEKINSYGDLRNYLNIPNDAIVFGCYGGEYEFDIEFVHDVIKNIVKNRKDIYFIFMNINKFYDDHNQIIHLPGTWDLVLKSKFINTCNAMLHARYMGESYGCAIAEFSMANKPVITYNESGDRCHIEILNNKGIYYSNSDQLNNILNNLNNYIKYDDYNTIYSKFSAENIISKFKKMIV